MPTAMALVTRPASLSLEMQHQEQQQQWRHRAPADGGEEADHKKKRKGSRVAVRSRRQLSAREQQLQALGAPAALVAVGVASVWCGLRGIIGAYQQLRRHSLRRLLHETAPVLDTLGVTYWADFGTLLGMYREKDIIKHDNDVDVVVLDPEWGELLAALKAALPHFRVYFVVPSEDTSIRWIRLMTGAGVMDVYGGYSDPADPKNVTIPQGHGDLCDVRRDLVLPTGRLGFRGTPVSVPSDVPGVLRHRYGDTFMVPRYMDKGRDVVEQAKPYARLLAALGKAGLRI